MTAIFSAVLILVIAGGLLWLFLTTPANRLAGYLTKSVPIGLIAIGGFLMLIGRGAMGFPLAVIGFAWWRRTRGTGRIGGAADGGKKSKVRSLALEMILDHDTGDMNGRVLTGPYKNKMLSEMTQENLLNFYDGIRQDHDSVALLEAYLDRSFEGWRDNIDETAGGAHAGYSSAGSSGSGAMTRQEAYKILGLEPGASEKEIKKAWRKLIKGIHPDSGGSEFLATKINAAKDTLLD